MDHSATAPQSVPDLNQSLCLIRQTTEDGRAVLVICNSTAMRWKRCYASGITSVGPQFQLRKGTQPWCIAYSRWSWLVAWALASRPLRRTGQRFADRPGGYTRVVRLAEVRLGDAGRKAIIEFTGERDRAKSGRRRTAPVVAAEKGAK